MSDTRRRQSGPRSIGQIIAPGFNRPRPVPEPPTQLEQLVVPGLLCVRCTDCSRPVELPADSVAGIVAHVRRQAVRGRGVTLPAMRCLTCREAAGRAQREDRERAEAHAREQARAETLAKIRANPAGAIAYCGVPERFTAADLDATCPDLPAALVADLRQWADRPAGFAYLVGQPGSGKTWCSAAVLRRVLLAGIHAPRRCRFIDQEKFLGALPDSFSRFGQFPDVRKLAESDPARVELLVFDELAVGRMTPSAERAVSWLLRQRHTSDLPTLVTGNHGLLALAETLDARIASRLAEGLVVEFPARDLRVGGSIGRR